MAEYDPNVPEFRSDSLKTTQQPLQDNFQALFNAFLVNHVSINDAVDTPGNHTLINLIEQVQAIQTEVDEINIYSKDDPDTTDQLFFRYQGNGQEFQFTDYQIYSTPPVTDNKVVTTGFFTFLPGKVIVYFGSITGNRPLIPITLVTLVLQPPIAKNIITISACSIGSDLTTVGAVELLPPVDGFFKSVTFLNQNIYYLVMANI